MSDSHAEHRAAEAPEHAPAHAPAAAGSAMDSLLTEEMQPAGAPAIARFASVRPLPPSVSRMSLSRLQRSAGNAAVARLMPAAQPAGLAIQRAVYKEGGKGAVAVPANAKSVKLWVTTKTSVQAGGSNHIADIQGRGFPGFKKGKEEFAGGRVFNNGAQPDGNKLPWTNGQTYQEWDINPCVVGQNRGGDRIITGSDGKAYFTNDHYANFTEFK